MAYIKANDVGDQILETGYDDPINPLNQRLAESSKTKTTILLASYEALAWVEFEHKYVVIEVKKLIENLPW